ncbi:MAG: leucyl aminopeptidase [Bacteroidota bacterium]
MKIKISKSFNPYPEALIVPMVQNDGLENALTKMAEWAGVAPELALVDFKADWKEIITLYPTGKNELKRIYLLGLGKQATSPKVLAAFRSAAHHLKSKLPKHTGISFLRMEQIDHVEQLIEAAVNGLLLGQYEIGVYKTDNKTAFPLFTAEASLDVFTSVNATAAVAKAQATAATQIRILDLVNAPANKKTPQTLADWAVESGKQYGYSVEVFDKEKIEALGMHALLAVNQGSELPPAFLVLEYQPNHTETEAAPLRKVGLVGKGVTFDTGGISIKGSEDMHMMKSDMGGAAAVLGTLELAAKLQLPVHLVGVIPATENSVDAKALKPGDVIGSYLGKTIEVIDTDAEGRLILADALAYLNRNHQPEVIVDLATLTGSCIRTLGYYAAGLFTNSDSLAASLMQAADQTGERLWRLPLWEEYEEDLHSDVADMKNYSGKPIAGAISGAKFLEVFTEKHAQWAHLDIAGVAFADSEFAKMKSATAFGVRLLIEFLSHPK